MSFFFKKVENFILGEDNTLEIAQRKADGEDRVELLRKLKEVVRDTCGLISDQAVLTDAIDAVPRLLEIVEECLWHGMYVDHEPPVSVWGWLHNLELRGDPDSEMVDCFHTAVATRHVKTDCGKARAWIRSALNMKVLDASISELLTNPQLSAGFYEPWALMRCGEGSQIMVALFSALHGLEFNLLIDIASLDQNPRVTPPRSRPRIVPGTPTAAPAPRRVPQISTPQGQELLSNAVTGVRTTLTKAQSAAASAAVAAAQVVDEGLKGPPRDIRHVTMGVRLQDLVLNPHHCVHAMLEPRIGVPELPRRCLRFLNACVDLPDLFVSTAAEAEILSLLTAWDTSRTWSVVPDNKADVLAVVGLLKRFLYFLPVPLLSHDHYLAFVCCAELPDDEETDARARNVRALIGALPISHRTLLVELLTFLARHCHIDPDRVTTKAESLAIARQHTDQDTLLGERLSTVARVFAPLLLRPPAANGQTPLQPAEEAAAAMMIVKLLILRCGFVLQDLATELNMRRALLKTRVEALTELHRLSRVAFNPAIAEHIGFLAAIWEVVVNGSPGAPRQEFRPVSSVWQAHGFQTDNPVSDLSAGGVLCVECVAFLVDKYKSKVLQVIHTPISESAPAYPFSIACVNVFCMLARVVRFIEDGEAAPSEEKPINCMMVAAEAHTFWRFFCSYGRDAFFHLYCFAFLLLDKKWRAVGASLSEFGRVLFVTEKEVIWLLAQFPHDPEEMWQIWIDRQSREEAAQTVARVASEMAAASPPPPPPPPALAAASGEIESKTEAAAAPAPAPATATATTAAATATAPVSATAPAPTAGPAAVPAVASKSPVVQPAAARSVGHPSPISSPVSRPAVAASSPRSTGGADTASVPTLSLNAEAVAPTPAAAEPTPAGAPSAPAVAPVLSPARSQSSVSSSTGVKAGSKAIGTKVGAKPAVAAKAGAKTAAASTATAGSKTTTAAAAGAKTGAKAGVKAGTKVGAKSAVAASSSAKAAAATTAQAAATAAQAAAIDSDTEEAAPAPVARVASQSSEPEKPASERFSDSNSSNESVTSSSSSSSSSASSASDSESEASDAEADGVKPSASATASTPSPAPAPAPVPAPAPILKKVASEAKNESSAEVLSAALKSAIVGDLPLGCKPFGWSRVFQSRKGGKDLSEMIEAAEGVQFSVLLIRDAEGQVFGGFAPSPWTVASGYTGDDTCFVFSFPKGKYRSYKATGSNALFQRADDTMLAFGGGSGFAIFLDPDLSEGTSAESTTFDNEVLSSDEDFDTDVVELWALNE